MSAVFVWTAGDAIALVLCTIVALVVAWVFVVEKVNEWRAARRYAKCNHAWRATRGRRKSPYAESSWPTRTCNTCGKVERT